MCTVSIIALKPRPLHLAGRIPEGVGFRVVCNRDEVRSRAPSGAPKWRAIERAGVPRARAIWPMDMEAGGTWIAAAEHGLVLSLLNLNLEPSPDMRGVRGLKSRGLVIPSLIGSADAEEAMRRVQRLNLRAFAPFRLVAADARSGELRIAEARWDRREIRIASDVRAPACFVSSGLGDSLAQPRLKLFESTVLGTDEAMEEGQDRFHRHTWPERPEISVMMSRADARTVSVTTIEAVRDEREIWDMSMDYEAIREEAAGVGQPVVPVARRAAGVR